MNLNLTENEVATLRDFLQKFKDSSILDISKSLLTEEELLALKKVLDEIKKNSAIEIIDNKFNYHYNNIIINSYIFDCIYNKILDKEEGVE